MYSSFALPTIHHLKSKIKSLVIVHQSYIVDTIYLIYSKYAENIFIVIDFHRHQEHNKLC